MQPTGSATSTAGSVAAGTPNPMAAATAGAGAFMGMPGMLPGQNVGGAGMLGFDMN